ncbi:AhpC/TSA family protein [Pedobacter sp. Hv1]|uniref:AhpC/TSA family protein n=1 Tax=Pedobacter sp. Hv1 TaxID=1740090 RepID=UPI0006D8A16E|nr:AhpC/TSA family protein [Pedobacter sp. Hv1]KQB98637.1 alkyl hydroperoxide reductase [Pedobacter sp. Hv1]
MKKLSNVMALLLLGSSMALAQQKEEITITGTVKGLQNGKVYLQKFNNKMFFTIDSATVKDGQFQFNQKLILPELYGLTLNKDKNPLYVFLEAGKINADLDTTKYYTGSVISGSKSNDLFIAYKKERNVDIKTFIQQNPNSIVSAYVLYRDFSYRLSAAQIEENISYLAPSLQQTPYVGVLKELIGVLSTVAIGKPAPVFTALNQHGQSVSLSQFRGKYLLIDFWAAWCGPCRKENPNVVAAYQKYHAKGFDILGVSLDKSKADWLAAIAADQLNWTQVSDLKFWNSAPAKLYGVRAIPANVLIDPQGLIIGRNLRGEELQQTLERLFSTAK